MTVDGTAPDRPGPEMARDAAADAALQRRPYASPVCYAEQFERLAVSALDLPRAIVEQAAEAVVFSDCDGVIRLWNRGAERLFGFATTEALGASLDLIVPEHLRRPHWDGYRRAIETGALRNTGGKPLVTRSLHKSGRRLYVEFSFGLARDPRGGVVGAFAIGRDCTERMAAAAASKSP
ncbi:MAG: PAS domain S-box protein [Nitrospira sp.]|nr:PAS domain S-box protein [Nitrospira sp.]